jgi:hypothetical protein
MAFIGLKPPGLMTLALIAAWFYAQSSSAAEPLGLKLSLKLGTHSSVAANSIHQQKPETSLLGKMNLFKGVEVEDELALQSNQTPVKTGLTVSESKPQSPIKAIYGGLQVSLQENLSVVYTPGRLSTAKLNGEGDGLYLMTNRGGLANWFFGVESSPDSAQANSRRASNSAQLGVIFSLD